MILFFTTISKYKKKLILKTQYESQCQLFFHIGTDLVSSIGNYIPNSYYEPNLNDVGTVCCWNTKPPRFSINLDSLIAFRWSAVITTSCKAIVCSAVKPVVSKAYQA